MATLQTKARKARNRLVAAIYEYASKRSESDLARAACGQTIGQHARLDAAEREMYHALSAYTRALRQAVK